MPEGRHLVLIIILVTGLAVFVGMWVTDTDLKDLANAIGLLQEPPPTPTPTQTPASAPPPTPARKPAPAPKTKPTPRLAPPGIVFLVNRMTIKSDSGVIGINPGTKLRVLKEGSGTLTVTDGKYEFDAPIHNVTNLLDFAEYIIRSDAEMQAQLRRRLGESSRAFHARRQAEFARQEEDREKYFRENVEVPRYINPLERGAYDERRAVQDRGSSGRDFFAD